MPDSPPTSSGNRRGARTRAALRDAFNRLVLRDRRRDIRVAEIVAEAGVGRSTFYDHYDSADELFLEALAAPLGILADAASGHGDPARLASLLGHFWENRQRARSTFEGRTRDRVTRLLASLIAQRLGERPLLLPLSMASLQLAEAALAPVRAWVTGKASCSAERLAESLCRTGANLAASLASAEAPEPDCQADEPT